MSDMNLNVIKLNLVAIPLVALDQKRIFVILAKDRGVDS